MDPSQASTHPWEALKARWLRFRVHPGVKGRVCLSAVNTLLGYSQPSGNSQLSHNEALREFLLAREPENEGLRVKRLHQRGNACWSYREVVWSLRPGEGRPRTGLTHARRVTFEPMDTCTAS